MILTYQQLLEEQREYYAHTRGQSMPPMPPILPSRRVGPFTDRHQPWCRIFHNPGSTTECWCDSQIAATAYKLGVAEGTAMLAVRNAQERQRADDLVPENALNRGSVEVIEP